MFNNINWLKKDCKINIESINCPNIFIPQLDQIIKNVDKGKKWHFYVYIVKTAKFPSRLFFSWNIAVTKLNYDWKHGSDNSKTDTLYEVRIRKKDDRMAAWCALAAVGFESIKDREESFNSSRRLGLGVRDLCSKQRPFVIAGTVTSHGLSWLEKSKLNLTSLTDNSCSDLWLSLPPCVYRYGSLLVGITWK